MGKTKNQQPLGGAGRQGIFSQLRGPAAPPPRATPRGAEKISAQIINLCQQSSDQRQVAELLRDSGQDAFLTTMIDAWGQALLADTLISSYYPLAHQQVDISGHNLLSDQLIKRGLLLPQPIDSDFLFAELRWSLAHSLVSNVPNRPPTEGLHKLFRRCSDHGYALAMEENSKFALAALKNFQQAIDQSEENQEWAAGLSAQQTAAAQKAFTTLEYLLNQPERPDLFSQLEETIAAVQVAFQPPMDDDRQLAQTMAADFGRRMVAGWVLGSCSIAINRQLGDD